MAVSGDGEAGDGAGCGGKGGARLIFINDSKNKGFTPLILVAIIILSTNKQAYSESGRLYD